MLTFDDQLLLLYALPKDVTKEDGQDLVMRRKCSEYPRAADPQLGKFEAAVIILVLGGSQMSCSRPSSSIG